MGNEAAFAETGAALASRIAVDARMQEAPALSIPMRRVKRQVTDPEALKAIVDACKTVRLGAADEHGIFIVPMSFGYEFDAPEVADVSAGEVAEENTLIGEAACGNAPANEILSESGSGFVRNTAATIAAPKLTLWLHSATEGRKARAFADGMRVAVEMDLEDGVITGDYSCSYSYAYRSIMGQGHIHRVEDKAAKLKGLKLIMGHMAPGSHVEFADEAVERVAVWRVDVEHFTGKQRAAKA